MPRPFKTVDYAAALNTSVRLRDCLPPTHLACFVADLVGQLDVAPFYARYAPRGGSAYAPEVLLSLLLYGYATGVFSSRALEAATYDQAPFRYLAGHTHPDHDTLAAFRTQFLDLLPAVFQQLLLLAATTGVLQFGQLVLAGDGTKIRADASKSKAVSYGRLDALETRLQTDIATLLERGATADAAPLPDGLVLADEIADREAHLARLADARRILEERAQAREAAATAAYEAALAEREAQARRRGKQPGGRPPQPPASGGPTARDQYNFTDPDSRVMKNPTDTGFSQAYNSQILTDQASLLIVGYSVSNHPTDIGEIAPALESVPAALDIAAIAYDTGYWREANVAELERRAIDPYIATGRRGHRRDWQAHFEPALAAEPPAGATARERMSHKLQTMLGQVIYRGRKCTVEPVIGIIKEVLGFRQFSLRGQDKVAGEWGLVCLAYNLKRMHRLARG
ncbi:MAG: transposase [Chloroflexota bacterium]|nr:transposase [Chloroflexota bacterium]